MVLTVGTFLGGRIHVGLDNYRAAARATRRRSRLAARLRELAPRIGRLKTGTPPRIDGRSIDYSRARAAAQRCAAAGVFVPRAAPASTRAAALSHHHTNERTHEIIRAALDRSPMYTGAIEGVGPRYCPSIEDKVERFADKSSHQIFIEPEGLDTHEVYPNGISTSLPFDVQYAAGAQHRAASSGRT